MLRILFLFFMFASLLLRAQPGKLVSGQTFPIKENDSYLTYVGDDAENYYLVRLDYKDYWHYLCRFDNTTSSQQYQSKIELKEDESFAEAYLKNGKLLVSTTLTKAGKDSYLFRVYDAAKGSLINGPKVMEELASKRNKSNVSFGTRFSPDGTKMLTLLLEEKANGLAEITAKLYETDTFKKIWEKHLSENYDKDATAWFSNFLTDNAGRLIYLITHNLPNAAKDEMISGICTSEPTSSTTSYIPVPSEKKTNLNISLELLGNDLICTGEFLDGQNTPKSKATLSSTGFFMLSINLSEGKIVSQSYDHLSQEIQSKLHYHDANPSYRMDGIANENKRFKHFRSYMMEGALYVIKYHGYDYKISPSSSMGVVNHHGNEIIVLKYLNGKLEWMQIIPRDTHSTGDYYYKSSTLQVMSGKKLYIFYYDRKKNFDNYPDPKNYEAGKYEGIATLTSETFPVCLTLDKFGNMKREILAGNSELRLWNSDNSLPKNSSTLILAPVFEKKTGRIDLLKFN